MSTPFLFPADDAAILVVDDSVDDVTEILTIACESFGSRGNGRTFHDGGRE